MKTIQYNLMIDSYGYMQTCSIIICNTVYTFNSILVQWYIFTRLTMHLTIYGFVYLAPAAVYNIYTYNIINKLVKTCMWFKTQ